MGFDEGYAKKVSEREFISHFQSKGAPFNTIDLKAKYYELRGENVPEPKKDLKEAEQKEK